MIDEREYDRIRGLTVIRDPTVSTLRINPETGNAHCPPHIYDELKKRFPEKRYVMK